MARILIKFNQTPEIDGWWETKSLNVKLSNTEEDMGRKYFSGGFKPIIMFLSERGLSSSSIQMEQMFNKQSNFLKMFLVNQSWTYNNKNNFNSESSCKVERHCYIIHHTNGWNSV